MRPAGWLIALAALVLAVSVWLPWLTTSASGGGRANAIGGATGSVVLARGFGPGQAVLLVAALLMVAGCMVGQHLLGGFAPLAAGVLALTALGLVALYHHVNVAGPLVAGYGMWIGVGSAGIALVLAIWASLSRSATSKSPVL